jgi:hypothetical protein
MNIVRSHKVWTIVVVVLFFLGIAALAGIAGCGGGEEAGVNGELYQRGSPDSTVYDGFTETTAGATTTYAAATTTTMAYGSAEFAPNDIPAGSSGDNSAQLTTLEGTSGQKVIADAALDIQVEKGKFQTAFEQARLLADRYGGYLVSSESYASGEEDSMQSGTVAIRVPSQSLNQALNDAAKLGTLKSQQIRTQDVTEEYVDLQARITNSQANVNSLLALLAKAKTVDDTLQVQQVLTYAQQELEQLKGRQRFLDEHTSFSTLTMTIHEAGVEVKTAATWGTGSAFRKALHNLVDAINAIIRGLGVLIPVLIVLAIIGYIVYRIWRTAARRNRQREQARYQPYPPQGWGGQPPAGVQAQPAVIHPAETAPQAPAQPQAPPSASGPEAPGASKNEP